MIGTSPFLPLWHAADLAPVSPAAAKTLCPSVNIEMVAEVNQRHFSKKNGDN